MRYSKRGLQWRDLVPLFEEKPSSTHVRNALAIMERLRDEEGKALWPEGSEELSRWQKGWKELWGFMNRLGERRHVEKQDLPTALREFIHKFEHETGRMIQMLYSQPDTSTRDSNIESTSRWCNFAFKCAVYAVVSFWIDNKTEERITSIEMGIDYTTGKITRTKWSNGSSPCRGCRRSTVVQQKPFDVVNPKSGINPPSSRPGAGRRPYDLVRHLPAPLTCHRLTTTYLFSG